MVIERKLGYQVSPRTRVCEVNALNDKLSWGLGLGPGPALQKVPGWWL